MRNLNNIKKLVILVTILFSQNLVAQTTDALGTFTPYSIFGVGEISKQGTSFNRGMGGIGVGVKDNRFINYMNPASIVYRDTLSFMLDFGIEQKNFYNTDNKTKSAYNVFNMHNFIISAPLYKKSAMVFGITPFSDVGYKFESTETDPTIVSQLGDVKYQKYGTGGISKAFFGASMMIGQNLSVGAEANYLFGTIDKYSTVLFNSSTAYRSITTGWDYVVGSFTGKLGLQYSKKLARDIEYTLGATYMLKTKLRGDVSRYAMSKTPSGVIDTVYMNTDNNTKLEVPAEFALGFSIRKGDKWLFGADYVRQDWSNSNFAETPGVQFKPSLSNQYKAGIEFTPNRYDVRYYLKRCTYRAGLYYENTYLKIAGKQANAFGLTLGMNLPIYQTNNAIGLAVDMGQRGSLKNNLVRERYIMFVINIHLHDIWFLKYKYD